MGTTCLKCAITSSIGEPIAEMSDFILKVVAISRVACGRSAFTSLQNEQTC